MKPTAKLAEIKQNMAPRQDGSRFRVRVGMATCGISAGAGKVYDAFIEQVKLAGLENVDVIATGCVGRCDMEPLVEVTRGDDPPILYSRITADKVGRIIEEHLVGDKVVEEYIK